MHRLEKAFLLGFVIAAIIAIAIFYFNGFTVTEYWKAFWTGFGTLLGINVMAALGDQFKKWSREMSKLKMKVYDMLEMVEMSKSEIDEFLVKQSKKSTKNSTLNT